MYSNVAPTEMWDRLVVLSLAQSWFRQERNELSTATVAKRVLLLGLIGHMVHLTNVVYDKTAAYLAEKCLSPCVTRAANAGVIYETL
jgi:hypothetical protein